MTRGRIPRSVSTYIPPRCHEKGGAEHSCVHVPSAAITGSRYKLLVMLKTTKAFRTLARLPKGRQSFCRSEANVAFRNNPPHVPKYVCLSSTIRHDGYASTEVQTTLPCSHINFTRVRFHVECYRHVRYTIPIVLPSPPATPAGGTSGHGTRISFNERLEQRECHRQDLPLAIECVLCQEWRY